MIDKEEALERLKTAYETRQIGMAGDIAAMMEELLDIINEELERREK